MLGHVGNALWITRLFRVSRIVLSLGRVLREGNAGPTPISHTTPITETDMEKIDPIIAVRDVHLSAEWYQAVFGWKRTHGGDEFAVLNDENDEIVLCLHKWGEHEHPTMMNPNSTPGNGLILYYKTDSLDAIRDNVEKMNHPIDRDIHVNPNSRKKEFALRDNDGYYWIITEYHTYEG